MLSYVSVSVHMGISMHIARIGYRIYSMHIDLTVCIHLCILLMFVDLAPEATGVVFRFKFQSLLQFVSCGSAAGPCPYSNSNSKQFRGGLSYKWLCTLHLHVVYTFHFTTLLH